ncbi:MAG: hypothetical protein IKD89_02105 [Clostridia bacterium]|nr:hypothetical protein [Clostridia bacterium]
MSSDISTFIKFKGNTDELTALIGVIKSFETDSKKDADFDSVCIGTNEHDLEDWDFLEDEEIRALIEKASAEIVIEAEGPYGYFWSLSGAGLFQALAEAAPTAFFDGRSSGFDNGGDFALDAELKDGKLYLAEYELSNDELNKKYAEHIKEKLPYTEFCSIFKVDTDRFDADDYIAFLDSAINAPFDGWPYDKSYDEYMECLSASEITKEEYEKAIENLRRLKIADIDDFRAETIKQITRHSVYDPVTKKYKRS